MMLRGTDSSLRGRFMLGSATWVLAVSAAQATTPSCSTVSSVYTCTQGSGTFTSPISIVNQSIDAGDDGLSASLTNSGTFNITAGSDSFVLEVTSTGAGGVDDGNAGAGGSVTVKSTGALTLTRSNATSELIVIDGRSVGGDADRDNQNNNSDGGDGGDGAAVSIESDAAIVLGPSLPNGGIGIYGLSQGGDGGEPNLLSGVNRPGGNGGVGGNVTVTNKGTITIGSSSTPITQGSRAWGIRAESDAGGGDPDANEGDSTPASGAGGNVGTVTVSSDHKIDVHVDGTGSTGGGVAGIYASGTGGNGAASSYNYNNGGAGGSGGTINVTLDSGGDVSVSSARTLADGGAAVKATSQGGNGGEGNKQDGSGGHGGNGGVAGGITVNIHSTISAQGDDIVGVLADGVGGTGGNGNSENKSSGGTGGTGGAIQINLYSGSITTNGANAYGILGQSIGGPGGDGGDGSALFGSAGSAGAGGNSAGAGAFTSAGTTITTSGDFAAGIAFQSIGGGGGVGGDFVDLLGGGAGNGGNGGNGTRSAINSSSTITTNGDNAYGLLAQAIAGSGGTGGIASGLSVELGGDGGEGGTGGTGEILNAGNITTHGYGSNGIVLQSIGGGGGAAGTAGGILSIGGSSTYSYTANAGAIDFSNSGHVTTHGDAAVGIMAQSIGGGGGTGAGATGIISVGGSGSAGGSGGGITLASSGTIGTVSTAGEFAHGVLAQSIGGGGGNGGNAFDFGVEIPAIAIGGDAAGGGAGGTVNLNNSSNSAASSITTTGDAAVGMLVQSIGGGGGTGGDAGGVSLQAQVNLKIGGSGSSSPANGGNVTVDLDHLSIGTSQARSTGMLVQSIGGGGGSGGAASGYDAGVGFAIGVSVGGTGGAGGTGGTVNTHLTGANISSGVALAEGNTGNQPTDTFGVVVQSLGGGGGNGGSATADDLAVLAPTFEDVSFAVSVAVGVGGGSGAAGNGGGATVTLDGASTVTTVGQGSHGVLVQSVGGGGGQGGDSSSLSSTIGDGNTWELDVSVDVGRDGGSGGNGGAVNVTVGSGSDATKIITNDDYANAVLAQSIGGGGGNAGVGSSNTYKLSGTASANVDVGVGGKGATGGDGGTVTVHHNNVASIVTHGSGSRGILAQSVGGGGGTSQGTTVILGGAASDYSATVNVGVGRSGGSGGVGNKVQVFSVGGINTDGGDADGILAQSIGGGGGVGGSIGNDGSADHQLAEALSLIVDGKTTYTLGVAVGGQGGSGGTGGEVDVSSSSVIRTAGDWADGIVAQSVGGGGGVGGTSVASGSFAKADTNVGVGGGGGGAGNGGTVTATVETSVETQGYSAHGIVAQSVGGGGGQGGDGSDSSNFTVSVGGGAGVGGSGGSSGSGGNVEVQVSSGYNLTVSTAGDDAYGIVAQSVGGGGGMGGAGSSKGADKAGSYDFAVTVGGKSGSSGSGGTSTVNGKMGVTTAGDRAFGIVAQSIGGGGGIGGAASSESIVSLNLGGQAGSSGSGGAVSVTLASGSSVHTSGDGAHAIIAQSIGGGGGIGGDATGGHLDFTVGGATPNNGSGSAQTVTVNANASIQTDGDGAFGILAQSIAGGGGLGGDSSGSFAGRTGSSDQQGSSAQVTVTQAGSLIANGDGSIGIFAQSDGPIDVANIAVTVNGSVSGGSGDQGVGVQIDTGLDNTLTVGSGGSISAASGVAVRYTTRLDPGVNTFTITNHGTITGSIDDATGANTQQARAAAAAAPAAQAITLDNRGTVASAAELDADVRNRGTLGVGHDGTVDRTVIAGDLEQAAGGSLVVDLDLARRSADTLRVEGDASLDGTVKVRALSLLPNRAVDFLSVGGALQGGLEAEASPIFRYAVQTAGGTASIAVASADFSAPAAGRSANEREVARHLQAAWDDGGAERLGVLFATVDAQAARGAGAYGSSLSDLSLGVAAAPAARRQATMLGFADSLSSCPIFEDGTALLREDACMWARVAGSRAEQDADSGASGFDEDAIGYQLGAQWQVAPDWFLGMAAAYQRDWLDSDDGRSSSDGDSAFAGLSLKRQWGAWQVGGVLSGGYGWYDTTRKISIPGFNAKADSEPELQNVALRVRTAYSWARDSLYVRPYLDLDAIYTRQPGYDESGAGDLNLDVRSADQWGLVATPSIEVGGRVAVGETNTLRPYARLGLALSNQDDWTSKARLSSAPGGSGDFDSAVPMDEVTAKLGAGLQLTTQGGLELRLQYDGQFSSNVASHGGSLRIALPF